MLSWTFALPALRAESSPPERVDVPAMRTSIYIGSVTLSLGTLERAGETYKAKYEAKVLPWRVWSESGAVTLNVPATEFERLRRGEAIEVSGEALNQKGRTRSVSAKVQPTDVANGKIKVRINAGGTKLIFNGSYRFAVGSDEPPLPADESK